MKEIFESLRVVTITDHPSEPHQQVAFIPAPEACFELCSMQTESMTLERFTAYAHLFAACRELPAPADPDPLRDMVDALEAAYSYMKVQKADGTLIGDQVRQAWEKGKEMITRAN